MVFPIVPSIIAGLATVAIIKNRNSTKGVMTPERTIVYETALSKLKDSVKLHQLADAFESEGLRPQANVLRKRAALRDLPREVREARRTVFRKAMSSTDATAVKQIANAYRADGATGAADALDKYAAGLTAHNESVDR